MIEAAILLHDEDEVLDISEARRSGRRRSSLSGCAARDQQRRQHHRQQGKAGAKTPIRLHHLDKTAMQAVVAVCNFERISGFRT
jgi:hypothetical protein